MSHDTGGRSMIPLDEFTRSIPPGWKPGLHRYSFKQYTQLIKLWWRSRNVEDDGVAAILIASRLQGLPRRRALNFRVTRENIEYVGDDALVLPALIDPQTGHEMQSSGLSQFLTALKAEHGLHSQDAQFLRPQKKT